MPIAAIFTEKDLLVMALSGDKTAFLQPYKVYLNNLSRYIFSFTKSRKEIDEIIPGIFLRIWENRDKLVEEGSFQNYLLRCADNKNTG